nr:hypothetical protein [Tanacetum cinerariifolium]
MYQDQSTPSTWPHLMLRFPLRISLILLMLHPQPYLRATLIVDSNLDEDLKDESKDGPMDYPANEGNDDDNESFGDDADDEEAYQEDEEEEEEHLALADSTAVSLAVNLVPYAKETKLFETDKSMTPPPPPPAYRTTSKIRCALLSVLDLRLRRVLLLLLLGPLGYRADYGFIGTLDAELRRDQVREIGYKITNVWEDPTEATKEVPPTTMAELSQRVMDLLTTVRKDTDEIYVKFEDV